MAQKPRTKPTPAQLRAQAAASMKVLEARARAKFRAYMVDAKALSDLQAAEHGAPYPKKKDGAA